MNVYEDKQMVDMTERYADIFLSKKVGEMFASVYISRALKLCVVTHGTPAFSAWFRLQRKALKGRNGF